MSTAKTDTQRDSIDAESIDAFFTFTDDDTTQPTPQPKPVPTVVSKPTRNDVEPIAFQPRPKTCSAYRDTTPDEPSDWWITALRCFSVLCFVVAIGLFVKPYFNSPNTTHTALKPAAASSSQPPVTTRNIEDCELGQRALGKNPLRDQIETLAEPDPETSRKIVLRMRKESGHRLDIQLIRSLSWIESVGAVEHESFYLNMEEMGAVGDAYVEAVLPCPPIQKGDGNVITGIFAHEADPETRILSVTFSNGAYLKGVTDNHPFWSVDRNDFVEIGEMNEGDWVKTASGLTQITNLDSRYARSGEMLYNLETHNEHVFQVTTAGILVHNTCTTVYRVLNGSEDVAKGIFAKRAGFAYPEGVNTHVLHGSRKWFEGDKWISTTRSLQRAKEIQAEFGGRIVKIDLKKAGNSIDDVIDLTDDAARAAHLKGWRANNYATKNLEVLLEGIVPPEAITPLF